MLGHWWPVASGGCHPTRWRPTGVRVISFRSRTRSRRARGSRPRRHWSGGVSPSSVLAGLPRWSWIVLAGRFFACAVGTSASSRSSSAFAALHSPSAAPGSTHHGVYSLQQALGQSPAIRSRTVTPLHVRCSSRPLTHAVTALPVGASTKLPMVPPRLWVPNKALQRTRPQPGSP